MGERRTEEMNLFLWYPEVQEDLMLGLFKTGLDEILQSLLLRALWQ